MTEVRAGTTSSAAATTSTCALWRELADREGSPVLDVGAGTGRVALDLARRGHEVVALDLERRAARGPARARRALAVTTVAADARDFDLDRRFPLVVVPMQTLQLLGGADGRARFLARAREHLRPGGLLAGRAGRRAARPSTTEHDEPPTPDLREVDGVVYASRPVAVRDLGDRAAIDRVRQIVATDGTLTTEDNVVELDRVDARRARGGGGRVRPARRAASPDPADARVRRARRW